VIVNRERDLLGRSLPFAATGEGNPSAGAVPRRGILVSGDGVHAGDRFVVPLVDAQHRALRHTLLSSARLERAGGIEEERVASSEEFPHGRKAVVNIIGVVQDPLRFLRSGDPLDVRIDVAEEAAGNSAPLLTAIEQSPQLACRPEIHGDCLMPLA
jgi:hypothetical protein